MTVILGIGSIGIDTTPARTAKTIGYTDIRRDMLDALDITPTGPVLYVDPARVLDNKAVVPVAPGQDFAIIIAHEDFMELALDCALRPFTDRCVSQTGIINARMYVLHDYCNGTASVATYMVRSPFHGVDMFMLHYEV
jgi:hypothetical protein